MKITQKKVAELIPYVNNSRTHSDEQVAQIAASIKEFGFTNPVLISDTYDITPSQTEQPKILEAVNIELPDNAKSC
jgi:hypothetical protein